MRAMLATSIPIGFTLGTLEVGLPAFGIDEGSRSFGALAIAALSLGSAAGGLLYGARPPERVVAPYLLFATTFPFGVALLVLPTSLAAMLVLAPLAGATLAPLTAVQNELIGRVAPHGTVTEAYAWIITGTILGVAIGTAIAGAVIEASGWSDAILVGAAVGLLGTAVAVGSRGLLAARHP